MLGPGFAVDDFGPRAVAVGGVAEGVGLVWFREQVDDAFDVRGAVADDGEAGVGALDYVLHEAVAEGEAADALDAVFFNHSLCEFVGCFVFAGLAFEPCVGD